MTASFVVVNSSGEEESALRMVKRARLVENLITLPRNAKAQPAILKGPLKNPDTERSMNSLTVMTLAIRSKKKYRQYPQKMLLIPWK